MVCVSSCSAVAHPTTTKAPSCVPVLDFSFVEASARLLDETLNRAPQTSKRSTAEDTSTTLSTVDTDSMQDWDTSEGSETDTESAPRAADEDVTMMVRIAGTKIVDGVLHYRVYTPVRKGTVSSVLRRYSDFVKLDNALAASRCSRVAVPVTRGFLPGTEVVGLRRILNSEKFLQRRQDMLQKYLDVIAAQGPVSSQDKDVHAFLHHDAARLYSM